MLTGSLRDQIARRGDASPLCRASSASYSTDLTQARKWSRSVMTPACACPGRLSQEGHPENAPTDGPGGPALFPVIGTTGASTGSVQNTTVHGSQPGIADVGDDGISAIL